MKHSVQRGLISALITPINEYGNIDTEAFSAIVKKIEPYHSGFLIAGSTGQGNVLELREKRELVHLARKIVAKKSIIVGVGGNDSQSILRTISTLSKQTDAFLLSAPTYTKMKQERLSDWFDKILTAASEANLKPVILYDVPSRTGNPIENKTIKRLVKKHKNLIGVKGASGDLRKEQELCQIMRHHKRQYWLGDDQMLLRFELHTGFITGLISVVSQAFPSDTNSVLADCMTNAKPSSTLVKNPALTHKFAVICHNLFSSDEIPNPEGITAVLSLMNLCQPYLREPLGPLTEKELEIAGILTETVAV